MTSLTLSSVLVNIGSNLQSALEANLSREAATALEAVRRAACTGARGALEAPPPALLHPCKFGSGSFLYGSVKQPPVHDVPYREGRWSAPPGLACVGGLVMDVAKNAPLPCAIFASLGADDEIEALYVFVPNVPLGACEAELFDSSTTAFERLWLGEEIKAHLTLRLHVGRYIRECGLHMLPLWLLAGSYHLVRPGPLAFLRLRKPVNAAEAAALNNLLHKLPQPDKGVRPLSELLTGDLKITLYTVFQRQDMSEGVPKTTCAAALQHSMLGSLALALLKYAVEDDYYGVGDEDSPIEQNEEYEDTTRREENSLQTALVCVKKAEEAMAVEQVPNPQKERLMEDMFESTLRSVSMKIIALPATHAETVESIAGALMSESDAEIVKSLLESRDGSVKSQLRGVGACLNPRQGILICSIKDDGKVHNSTIAGKNAGLWGLDLDDVCRLALHSWITPIILTKKHIFHPQIAHVRREKLELSETTRLQSVRRGAPAPSVALDPSVMSALGNLEPVLAALQTIPVLTQKLEALKRKLHERPAPAPVAQPVRADSPAVAGLKRSLLMLQGQERLVKQVLPDGRVQHYKGA